MKSNKRLTVIFFGGILLLAGLADLKYRGKLYQKLPASIQDAMDTYFSRNAR